MDSRCLRELEVERIEVREREQRQGPRTKTDSNGFIFASQVCTECAYFFPAVPKPELSRVTARGGQPIPHPSLAIYIAKTFYMEAALL
ncbi:hypothetical protein IRJ41_012621 [Triplophysa rosa]|uniref:Uncharacterized protein n=1 Tax=Triplophysa rosa TaxID=992332 RepID=A0A9W7WUX1_TRIRA|nr:hypothetical protein IRJ41_012621 [Triplophysa rosa]